MKKNYALILFLAPLFAMAQTVVNLSPDLRWPKDTLAFKSLVTSLNGFIAATHQSNQENKFVLATQSAETFVLLDEIEGMEDHPKLKVARYYRPYLLNVISLPDQAFELTVAYLGIRDSMPNVRAEFKLLAYKEGEGFLFASPLLSATKSWKKMQMGAQTFHYKNELNKKKAQSYVQYCAAFDKKLKAETRTTDIYCCENLQEVEQICGVMFKSDYNGRTGSVWTARSGNRNIMLMGTHSESFGDFDPHDLWHERLSNVISRSLTNRGVDEGCAYLYGGSWGFSWQVILVEFQKQIASNPATDWKAIKETPVYFKTGAFQNSADYIVNALLVKKIEKEKGFAGVWEFLNCGKVEKGNANYYQALEKLTGITKENYNDKIWQLIRQK